MVLVTARIEARAPERRELAQALLDWVASARREAGALGAHVYEDMEDAHVFCVVGQWANLPAFKAHVRSPSFGSVLGALELLAGPSRVSITEVADDSPFMTLPKLRELRRSVVDRDR